MARAADLPGAAHLVLAEGVVHLDPASAVFEAMLEGWARQQRTRFLKWDSTIKPRLSLVRRLATFSNQYPWEVLACPSEDHAPLRAGTPVDPDADVLTCTACGRQFPVVDGIPVLLLDEDTPPSASDPAGG